MGVKTSSKSNPAKARSSTSRKPSIRQAAKIKHKKWSKDRSELARNALDRDADLLYSALKNPSTVPSSMAQADSVVSLVESMQGLGR